MVLINYAGKEINAKIVYYGPGLSGKTTNLECIYASVPETSRGKMVSMKTRQDRTLFFDFLPLELGEVHGFRTRFLLYTVPGQVFYNATRKLVLKGADAVVFVADSQKGKMEDNLESLRNLEENLRENNLALESLPWVLQYNKRDLPDVFSISEMQQALNPRGVPYYEGAAATGRGVYETLHGVSKLLFQRLVSELGPGTSSGVGRKATPQATASAPAPEATPRPGVAPEPNVLPGLTPQGTAPPAQAAASPSVDVEAPQVSPQAFSVRGGNQPAEPTPNQIIDSVQAFSEEPGEAGSVDYGHVVDLSLEVESNQKPEPPAADGFIKDPMRRAQGSVESATRPVGAGKDSPAKTLHVPVRISSKEVKPGTTVRIMLDLKIEP